VLSPAAKRARKREGYRIKFLLAAVRKIPIQLDDVAGIERKIMPGAVASE
jgi:hypothetical protein